MALDLLRHLEGEVGPAIVHGQQYAHDRKIRFGVSAQGFRDFDKMAYAGKGISVLNPNRNDDIVRNDKIDFSGLGDYGGILLSPGPGIPAEAGELLKLIEFCKYTHPILGICLGHQAIAETFGASLYNLSRPLHGHRSVLKKVDEHDPLFEDLADPIQVGRYHSWVIDPETMPGELITSSIDEQGHIMSFYHTELPIHGIQFHPESYISDCGSGIIRNWLKMVR